MFKGNKGEWSETYVLLKLLGDKELHVGDENLNKIPELLHPIVKILRDERDNRIEYHIEDEIKVIIDGELVFSTSINRFVEKSKLLLSKIKKHSKGVFDVPELEEFLNQIKCTSLKAKSSSKTDIMITLHDLKTNMCPTLGYSIKSQLGSPSSLLNASQATNIVYKIHGDFDKIQMKEINATEGCGKAKQRILTIKDANCEIKLFHFENNIFENNLILIDSYLPKILAEMLSVYFSSTKLRKVSEIVGVVAKMNPMQFDLTQGHKYYTHKIKSFLTQIAVGMMPGSVWDGKYDATGGYLVVKDDGEILAYHLYNKNQFEDYLFHNTNFETASTTRHEFCQIYENDGEYFIKLNLQLRFSK